MLSVSNCETLLIMFGGFYDQSTNGLKVKLFLFCSVVQTNAQIDASKNKIQIEHLLPFTFAIRLLR